MTKLYLITGFLGAGKTTFLHEFAKMFPDRKIALIINEFGKAGMDGSLLKDLQVELEEINNGSIFCACKIEQFEGAVSNILEQRHPDMIFVEASGLADPSAVRAIFTQSFFKEAGLEYAGAICLVDALRFLKILKTAKVCRMQLAVSDLVLVNKTDLAKPEQVEEIVTIAKGQKPNRPVKTTSFGRFERAWLEEMENAPTDEGEPLIHTKDITLQKCCVRVSGFDVKSLESFLKMFAEETYRIKGFVMTKEGKHYVDCVGPMVRPFAGETETVDELVVLYGKGLSPKKYIREAASWFPDADVEIE